MKENKYSSWENISNVKKLVLEINIKRITYIALIIIFVEIINFFSSYFVKELYEYRLLIKAISIILTVVNVLYLLISKIFYNKLLTNEPIAHFVHISFWSAIILCLTPFIIIDIYNPLRSGMAIPLNLTILCAILIIIPVFSRVELCMLYICFFIYSVFLLVIYYAPILYIIYSIEVIVCSFIMAYFVQSQYVKLISKLNFEVNIDYLTGIMNRRSGTAKMLTILELTKRQYGQMVVYMIDIDYFKCYNDQYGHLNGDKILQAVADAISKTFTRVSDVICRYGGEEFLVCSSIKENREAALMAKRIQEAIKALNIETSNKTAAPYLTVSIGYVIYNSQTDAMTTGGEQLIKYADNALYHAKNNGRNKIAAIILNLGENSIESFE